MLTRRQKIERFLAFLFPVQLVIFHFLSKNQDWIENIYIPYIFRYLTLPLRFTLGWLNVSLGLILFYVLLIFFLAKGSRAVIQTIRKRHRFDIKNTLIKGLGYLSIFYGIFMVFWGFAYHRRPYQATHGVNTANIKTPELEALCLHLAHLAKHYRQQLPAIRSTPTNFNSVFKRAPLGYQHLSKTAPELTVDVPSLKLGFNKEIMSYLNISGIYFPFTAEANLNEILPAFQAPFVTCHEMAHQLGFASEEEANYIAYLACMHHPNPDFRYAANHWLLYTSLQALKNADEEKYLTVYSRIDKEIIDDQSYAEDLWQKYDNPIPYFTGNILFDLFLKANDQPAGINSYNLAVELMVGEYRKNGLRF